jgi:hypothetical protein
MHSIPSGSIYETISRCAHLARHLPERKPLLGKLNSAQKLSALLFFLFSIFSCPQFARAESQFTIEAGSSSIDVTVSADFPQISTAQLKQWVQNAASAVIAYYGHYPVPHVLLRIRSFDGRGVRDAQTFSAHGGLIRIAVGNQTTQEALASDWTLTHEMVHLTFPSMPDENHWIEEGIATYVEPIARIQAGNFNAPRMWFELVRDMPKGLPEPGDQGLDHTHTWGRTYWGGALFCFLADIEIRKQTQNKLGLQDALRGILNSGGDMRQDWPLQKALKAGDQAVGVDVLTKLYGKMGELPMDVDLPALWKQLGVRQGDGVAQFDDAAPLAAIRKSITAPRQQN